MDNSETKQKIQQPVGSCPSEEELVKLMTGEVSLAEVDTLFDHISGCTFCESKIESFGPAQLESDLKPIVKDFDIEEAGDTHPTALANTSWRRSGSSAELESGPSLQEDVFKAPEKIGRYEILSEISRGGFGVVCKALDPVLKRHVAIKIPRPDRFETNAQIDAFIEEARTTAKLEHRNIVPVYDADTTDAGLAYIVMKWVDGKDLRSISKKKFSTDSACELVVKVCDAVHYAHQQGFIHRDLKPANILVDQTGEPFVTDFGLALHEDNLGGTRGEYAGTLAYMSPEQIKGNVDIIDVRTDVWSLGVMLYELLSCRKPFQGSSEDLATQILEKPPTPIRLYDDTVSDELQAVCFKALEKSCHSRIGTAKGLADQITKSLNPSRDFGRGAKVLVAAIGVLVLSVLGFLMFGGSGSESSADLATNTVSENDNPLTFVRLWLPLRKTCRFEHLDGEVVLESDESSIVICQKKLGDSFEIEAKIFQPGWTGQFGVVYGHDGSTYQLIKMSHFDGQYIFNRYAVDSSTHPAKGHHKGIGRDYLDTLHFPNGSGSSRNSYKVLRVKVVDSELQEFSIDGQQLAGLVKPGFPVNDGKFGFFVASTYIRIENLKLNGEEAQIVIN